MVIPHAKGLVKYHEREAERAIDLPLSALQLDPEELAVLCCLAGIYMEQGNRRTAAGYFRKALQDAGDEATAELGLSAGWCFGKVKDIAREIDAYRRCLRAEPNYQFARNNLGWALLKADRPEEAIPYLEKSLRSGADGRAPIFNLAHAYQRVGRLSEALEVLRRDRNEKGTLSSAAHRQIANLEALRGGDAETEHRSDPQVRGRWRGARRCRRGVGGRGTSPGETPRARYRAGHVDSRQAV